MSESLIRIGALATRTGVSTHLLRIWEERYGLLDPQRSASGYRLYSTEDEARVRRMVELRDQGVAASEAAEAVLESALGRSVTPDLDRLLLDLHAAFTRYDEAAFHQVLDTALVGHDVERVLSELLFPFLRRLGEAWEAGEISVAQEHYGSGLARGRMVGLVPGLARRTATGTTAVLACTPHERHDIGLLGLDLALRERGWTVHFLGADTPIPDALETCAAVTADVLVLCGTEPHMYAAQLEQHAGEIATVRSSTLVALGGPAATSDVARRHEALLLPLDVVAAAEVIAPAQALADARS